MAKITYENKVALNVNSDIADVNKCNASDLNEIKNVVNTNDDNVGLLSNLTTTDKSSAVAAINEINAKTNVNFCQMHTNFELKDFSASAGLTEVEGWEEHVNIGDYVADVANNRIIIENTTLVEVGGNTAGSGNGNIQYSLKESIGGTSLIRSNGWLLFQGGNVGSGYWAMPLKTCIVKLDPTKIYYLQLTASGYNEQNFSMNNGFGKFATTIYAKKIM